ncbi:hypothetical protein F2Q68_00005303 [Brassica cretica]|uniref:Uncharacterized protein n=1 Tax=Brassica cretica TaxID=69181 RepID=A0A8S9JEN6_BRACR|nr:hypothetical protein F2Q68_00005303 [Brassica cretica]
MQKVETGGRPVRWISKFDQSFLVHLHLIQAHKLTFRLEPSIFELLQQLDVSNDLVKMKLRHGLLLFLLPLLLWSLQNASVIFRKSEASSPRGLVNVPITTSFQIRITRCNGSHLMCRVTKIWLSSSSFATFSSQDSFLFSARADSSSRLSSLIVIFPASTSSLLR